ncbi:hypothetical protein EV127DRAFT_223857 [Xylaria flabelliformis]|nr:hypothetical protein EV127DRAFT_223857 [Xylaria flabelliformis]
MVFTYPYNRFIIRTHQIAWDRIRVRWILARLYTNLAGVSAMLREKQSIFVSKRLFRQKTPLLTLLFKAHCIDILRSSAMCRADTMIFPYHWSERNRVPNPTWAQKHKCVDWSELTEWLETRRVDIKALNMLVHPQYGPSYPGGKSIDEPNGPSWYPLDDETCQRVKATTYP